MASETDIANAALSKLGERRITSLADDSKPARAMAERYERLRDLELSTNSWRFACVRTSLPALLAAPAWGFSVAYQRPADDLKPLLVGGSIYATFSNPSIYSVWATRAPDEMLYEIVGDEIHTDLGAPLQYEYVKREPDTSKFSPMFVEALACRLAMDACEELTQSSSKIQAAAAMYQDAIDAAVKGNALWSPPKPKPMGRLRRSRFGW